MSRLLINSRPLMVIPDLAVKIGLNEALIMQQIHYWLDSSEQVIEGRSWVYNTYEDWQKQLPFWSVGTIKRTIRSLEEQGLLLTDNFNVMRMDKTKWYSIDYRKLMELGDNTLEVPNEGMMVTGGKKVLEDPPSEKEVIPFAEIISYLNETTGKNFRQGKSKTKLLIQARFGEGFTLDNFKRVIDLKSAEWKADPSMNKFLRPETLFETKFESYLNQQEGKKRMREEDFNFDE